MKEEEEEEEEEEEGEEADCYWGWSEEVDAHLESPRSSAEILSRAVVNTAGMKMLI